MIKFLFKLIAFSVTTAMYSCGGEGFGNSHSVTVNDTPSDKQFYANKKLNPESFVQWIEDKDNGLIVEKKINDFVFSAFYKPYEYLAIQELKKELLSKKEVDEVIGSLNELQYFTFRIKAENQNNELLKVGINGMDEYYARIEYCSFKMQEDLKLIEGKDTLDCALFHFERVYGIAPYATFVLGFPLAADQANIRSDKTLSYDDKLFNLGKINLTIKNDDIVNIPSLLLTN